MTATTASAPGKVVLSGEYAVLHGAPAVCMAVNRRAAVRLVATDASCHSVSATGYSAKQGFFVSSASGPQWSQGAEQYPLVDAAWRLLQPDTAVSLAIELDTSAFHDADSGAKLGLGSSAALTVALAAALTRSRDVAEDAMRIHRLFQSGAGSGVDIATSVRGGLIEYRMEECSILPMRWPAGLIVRLVWTGVAASTARQLEHFHDAGHRPSRDALVNAAERMAAAWTSAAGALSELPHYVEKLRRFSDDYDLDIFAAGHDTLATAAEAAGLFYKPCGAGGGDVGVLIGTSEARMDEFLADNAASGCRVVETTLATEGVVWEEH